MEVWKWEDGFKMCMYILYVYGCVRGRGNNFCLLMKWEDRPQRRAEDAEDEDGGGRRRGQFVAGPRRWRMVLHTVQP
ncbi:hypothetical protein HanLR1_Chr01g0020551 [Helianthus annuus]|nr:hypothetical protein HanHA89_Chr01g0021941 [Helianthus annuus]KAJ0783460.1 hypothetical protein HanLR1_Chr01g0020551 [Helianthus annuus]